MFKSNISCQSTGNQSSKDVEQNNLTSTDACGAQKLQHLVGGLSSATRNLDVLGNSRHYGSEEKIDPRIVKTRLNFVHNGSAVDSVINPKSKVIRIFCG